MLIERYLYQIRGFLPRKQRDDILTELRSELEDMLEDRAGHEASEADQIALLKEMGPPQDVAARYFPSRQYLIGPAIFPFFRTVAAIVLAASLGGQLLARLIGIILAGDVFLPIETFWDLINSIPPAVGMVVIAFFILQRLDVIPKDTQIPFDPTSLPEIEGLQPVKRVEHIIAIFFSTFFLMFIVGLSQASGWSGQNWVVVIENPVLNQNVPWIVLSVLLSIAVDLLLIWRGVWQTETRLAKIGAGLVSLVVISLLISGHSAWLAENASEEVLQPLGVLLQGINTNIQVAGMVIMRVILSAAALAVSVETLIQSVRLIRQLFGPRPLGALPEEVLGR
jgi:hypothetical protein